MTLADYVVFVTLVECKSLTLAAERLHFTKSAISHALFRMEKELGLTLFIRDPREFKLTDAAERLLPFANSVIREDNRFMEAVHGLHGLTSGSIILGTCSSTCINWIPDILNGFRRLYPDIKVQVKGGANNAEIIRYLDNNEIDLGIAAATPSNNLGVVEMYEDEMLCVVQKGHITAKEGVITASELLDMPLILQTDDFGEEALQVLQQLEVTPRPYLTTSDDASLVAMAAGGLGYCIVGKLVLKGLTSNVSVFRFDPPQYRYISLLYNKRVIRSPAATALSDYIIQYVKEYPDYDI